MWQRGNTTSAGTLTRVMPRTVITSHVMSLRLLRPDLHYNPTTLTFTTNTELRRHFIHSINHPKHTPFNGTQSRLTLIFGTNTCTCVYIASVTRAHRITVHCAVRTTFIYSFSGKFLVRCAPDCQLSTSHQSTFTRRTRGHCLGIFRTAKFSDTNPKRFSN